uniref:Protein kinase domain-containing protein n=1 Tax=Acrobeloides nanus TaxID=290746 RepID=A0A914E3I0_9BILA
MFEFKTDFGMIRYFENIKLGESNYPVYKGEIKQNGKENWITCAVKKLIIQTKKGDMRINQGVNIFKKLKHKHVVEYYDSEIITISNKNYMHICMELFDASMKDSVDYRKGIKKEKMGKNLDQIIKWLQPRNKFIILKQVVSGLEYLHEKNDDKNPIVHFNLKPANILLKMTNNPFNGIIIV